MFISRSNKIIKVRFVVDVTRKILFFNEIYIYVYICTHIHITVYVAK